MDEYIDKAALIESFKETIERTKIWRDDCRDLGITTEYADRAIIDFNEAALRVKNFPTVDAVKVVRCRDCKYFDRFYKAQLCYRTVYGDEDFPIDTTEDSFCSWGERKEDVCHKT